MGRLTAMEPSTYRLLLGAWLGGFVALEGYTFIVKNGVPEARTQMILTMICGALISQVFTFYVYLLLPRRTLELEANTPPSTLKKIWRDSGMDLISESLRVAALVLLWSLLGILPGVFKAIRWGFVPYIVMTDTKYRAGDVPARGESNRLLRGITWAIGFIWLAYFGLDVTLSWAEGFAANWDFAPLAFAWRLALSMVSFYLLLYSILLELGIYQRRVKARGGEA